MFSDLLFLFPISRRSLLQPADAVTVTVDGMAGSVRFTGTDTIRVIDEGKGKGKNTGTPLAADAGYALNNAETRAVYYFHCDHLGTPQAMTDQNGNVVWKADYKPFGEVTLTTSAVENNFRFPGQYFDEETGLHYNWHRYYNPETGRYLRTDPIEFSGGDTNFYGYGLNNPIRLINPTGLAWTTVDAHIRTCLELPTAKERIECLEGLFEQCADESTNKKIINTITKERPLIERLKGGGKLRYLRQNPNLKGVDIEDLLSKSEREIETMLKDGRLTKKQFNPIKKALQESRDLGGRKGGGSR